MFNGYLNIHIQLIKVLRLPNLININTENVKP